METNEFEQAFSNFLDRRKYDDAEDVLFSIVRTTFVAGWVAAGGPVPTLKVRTVNQQIAKK